MAGFGLKAPAYGAGKPSNVSRALVKPLAPAQPISYQPAAALASRLPKVTNVDPSSPNYNGPPLTPATQPAANPAPPAATPSGGGQSGGGQVNLASIDYSGDPILQKAKALSTQGRADAESGAIALKKQALIRYGYDPTLDTTGADKGLFPDESTLTAAQQNPFSTLHQLEDANTDNLHTLDKRVNNANLWYGSERGNQLAQAGHDFQLALSKASTDRQDTLSQIAQALAAARHQADLEDMQAEEAAMLRALQLALANAGGGRRRQRRGRRHRHHPRFAVRVGPSGGIANVMANGMPFIPTPIGGKRIAY
jgi:hypothetical protein